MERIAPNVLSLIGNTPLVELERVGENTPARLVVKLESRNPGGSEKDRAVLSMLERAEAAGLLDFDAVIIEPSSGNTGISLAMACAARGHRLIITMPELVSNQRVELLRALNAEVVLTPAVHGMNGAMEKAAELAEEYDKVFLPCQFENEANAEAHRATADEIWEQTDGAVTAVVAAVATGGTITGIGRRFRELKRDVRLVAVEPSTSAVLTDGEPGQHSLYGMGPPFVPELYDETVVDEVVDVGEAEAYTILSRLLREEGLLLGPTSAAAIAGAVKIARQPDYRDGLIVIIATDSIERYASTDALSRALNVVPMMPK